MPGRGQNYPCSSSGGRSGATVCAKYAGGGVGCFCEWLQVGGESEVVPKPVLCGAIFLRNRRKGCSVWVGVGMGACWMCGVVGYGG